MEETTITPKKRKPTVKRTEKTSAAVKKEIAKAVDNIPSLLAKESRQKEMKTKQADPQRVLKQKRQLLWAGVGIITTAVFGLWVYNIQTTFFDIKHTESKEGTILNTAKQDMQQAWAQVGVSETEQKKQDFEQKKLATEVKDILRNVLSAAAAASPNSTTISAPL
jgi:hypothetical protein